MPIIPLLPSDSAALVDYKIYLDSERDATITTPAVVQKWRRYYDGYHDLLLSDDQEAFLGKVISAEGTAALKNLNGGSLGSTDWPIDNKCRRVVDRVNSRLNVVGLTDESQAEIRFEDAQPTADALNSALRWWKASDLDTFEDDLYRAVLRDDEAYLLVYHDGVSPRFQVHQRYDGTTGIRAFWEDDERSKLLYATKTWRTLDPTETAASNVLRITVYTPVEVRKYIRPANERQYQAYAKRIVGPKEEGWYPIIDPGDESWPIPWRDSAGAPLGCPVIPFVSPRGSLVQAIIGLQNGLNKTNLDYLAAADQLGFGMIAIEYQNGLPSTTNSSGTEIDLAADGLGFRPGRVLDTSGHIVKLPADDLVPLANATGHWSQAIAANSDVPLHEVTPLEGQIPSGAALRMLESPFVSLVEKCQSRFSSGWRQAFDLAQKLALKYGGLEGQPTTIYPVWKEATVIDPAEQALADMQKAQTLQAYSAAGVPLESALRKMGWTEPEIADAVRAKSEEQAAAQESMAQALLRQQRAMEQQQPDGQIDMPMEQGGE